MPVVVLLVCIYNKLLGKSLNPPRSYSLDRRISLHNYPCRGHYLNQEWVMDGKGESLCTDGNSFPGLHSHHVCSGKPPDKAVAFLMAKKTTHTILILNSDRMVLLHSKHKILCSWFLSHHSYSDFIYHVIEIPTSYRNFEIQKLLKAILEFGNHLVEHHFQKWRVAVSGV